MAELKKQPELKDYAEQIKQCVKCGTCHAYCPIFDQERKEPLVARGKVALAQSLLNKETEIDARFMENLSKCLLCGSCSDKCPNLVPVERSSPLAARDRPPQGVVPSSFGLSTSLQAPQADEADGQNGLPLLLAGVRKVPEKSGLRMRSPPHTSADRTIPKVAPRFLRDAHPNSSPGEPGKPTVVSSPAAWPISCIPIGDRHRRPETLG